MTAAKQKVLRLEEDCRHRLGPFTDSTCWGVCNLDGQMVHQNWCDKICDKRDFEAANPRKKKAKTGGTP